MQSEKHLALYEIMDRKEIDYFRKNGSNSDDFLSIGRQIRKGIDEGIFAQDLL